MVAVESFNGMERQYFNSLNCAMTEYNRLMAHGRNPYFYTLGIWIMNNVIWDCELCNATNVPVFKDSDLGMWLCVSDYESFNGDVVDVDFGEAF